MKIRYIIASILFLVLLHNQTNSEKLELALEVILTLIFIAIPIWIIIKILRNKKNREYRKNQNIYLTIAIILLVYTIAYKYLLILSITFFSLAYLSNQKAVKQESKPEKTRRKRRKIRNSNTEFEEQVEKAKTITTNAGIKVQSKGEQLITNFLHKHNIDFEYDEKMSFKVNEEINGYLTHWLRPDFYLNEYNIIIEYFGMKGDEDYDETTQLKKRIYKESKEKLISITPQHLNQIEQYLTQKLQRYGINL